jgi:4-hydroxysphinganine ceramide fatty acyl 2-hydroxylase
MENTWSREEVATHNTAESCWVIYKDCVYDLTAFAEKHPGGKEKIIAVAGQEISDKMLAVEAHAKHWEHVVRYMDMYFIGHLSKN